MNKPSERDKSLKKEISIGKDTTTLEEYEKGKWRPATPIPYYPNLVEKLRHLEREENIEKIIEEETEKWMEERFGLADGAIFNLAPNIIYRLRPIFHHLKSEWIKEVKRQFDAWYLMPPPIDYKLAMNSIYESLLKIIRSNMEKSL